MIGNVRDNCYPHFRFSRTSALSIRTYPPFIRCHIRRSAHPLITHSHCFHFSDTATLIQHNTHKVRSKLNKKF